MSNSFSRKTLCARFADVQNFTCACNCSWLNSSFILIEWCFDEPSQMNCYYFWLCSNKFCSFAFQSIACLNVSYNPIASGNGLKLLLRNCTRLTSLNVSTCYLSDATFANHDPAEEGNCSFPYLLHSCFVALSYVRFKVHCRIGLRRGYSTGISLHT